MKYVIEHLEPELFEWCVIEYKHISKIVGKENLIITNVNEKDFFKIKDYCDVRKEKVQSLNLKNACVLDPDAEKMLKPEDKKFDYLIFGGILGDNPPKKRTKEELKLECDRRNMGKEQMATDNAVYVAKKIVDGTRFENIKFKDEIEVELCEGESVIFPFRYVLVEGKPLISTELINHLKDREDL